MATSIFSRSNIFSNSINSNVLVMKGFKGTKGKWEFVNTELSDFIITTVICEKQVIAHVNSVKENRIANALLISKAPEMLEMLIKLKDTLADGRTFGYNDYDRVEKLIKQATEL